MSFLPAYVAAVAASSFLAVGLVRRIAIRHGVMDHPSDRGSHVVATPRGGGLGAVATLILVSSAIASRAHDGYLLLCLVAAASVALVGWLDDRRGVDVRTRLLVHVAAAVTVGLLAIRGSSASPVAALLFIWWVFWTVSSINLINFADGINGLVASQFLIFATSLALFAPPDPSLLIVWGAAAAAIGFLPWNFPRARIFLGDVGSGTLGFLVPFLALSLMAARRIDIVQAHLPLVPLYADATFTILRRMRARERITQPHRTHLYQRLANGGWGHTRVTLAYAAASLCGAAVAHVADASARRSLIALYAGACALLGVLLYRRVTRA